MVPASLNEKFVIRFCVCAENARDEDIHYAYEIISRSSKELFEIIKLEAREKLKSISIDKPESPLTTIEQVAEEEIKLDDGKEIAELIKEENDIVQDVVVLDRKNHQKSLRYRRSFFVRMVSDPKFQQFRHIDNNKINRAFSTSSNPTTLQQSRQTSKDSEQENNT